MRRHTEQAFPRDDIDFVAMVDAAAIDAASPADLQLLLRAAYPNVIVRGRGLAGEGSETWYVYRDGSWTASREA